MRILLATDGSDDSKAAVAFLERLPLPPATVIRIISIVTLPPSPIDIPPVREYYGSLRAEGQRIVDQARAGLSRRVSIETRVLEGEPRSAIVREARDWGADMVVVGARGLGLVGGFLLGSVSIAVARHVSSPVLVVKGRPDRVKSIVVGLDGSDESMNAARFVAALPLAPDVSVRLVGAVEPVQLAAPALGVLREIEVTIRTMEEERRVSLEKALGQAAALFDAQGISVTCATPRGNPVEMILRAVTPGEIDLIVVGAHGRGDLERFLLGSVSECVLRDARCPVLIVKTSPTSPRADRSRSSSPLSGS